MIKPTLKSQELGSYFWDLSCVDYIDALLSLILGCLCPKASNCLCFSHACIMGQVSLSKPLNANTRKPICLLELCVLHQLLVFFWEGRDGVVCRADFCQLGPMGCDWGPSSCREGLEVLWVQWCPGRGEMHTWDSSAWIIAETHWCWMSLKPSSW